MSFLTLFYYTADHRSQDCAFEEDPRIVPMVTYKMCLGMSGVRKSDCLKISGDPYAMAIYKNQLLVVSGRDNTTLGRIDLKNPEIFSTEDLGYGNIQSIVVNDRGHAILPMWKNKKIMVYDLEKKQPAAYIGTSVDKLIGAYPSGDDVFVLSETPVLFKISMKDYSSKEFTLPYRHYNMYEIISDDRRGALFFTDWVSGLIYRYDMDRMRPDRQRWMPGLVTGLKLDSAKCELYASHGLPGLIEVLDCVSLKTIRNMDVGFGGHEMELTKDGKKIYLARYFSGRMAEIDRQSGKILFEARVGIGARDTLYDEKSNRLFVASRCGVREVLTDRH